MFEPRRRLRAILARSECTIGASIFDPLSARIADMVGWELVKLPGSVAKFANLAVPESIALQNMSDLVDVCRRITRVCNASLTVDADDGGVNALNIRRTVEDLEAAGVSGIEIEDNRVPERYGDSGRHGLMFSIPEQVGKLKAAVAARRDSDTVIIARSGAFDELPLAQAAERLRAYSDTGVEGIMLPAIKDRAMLEAVAGATHLPLLLLRVPADVMADKALLNQARVRVCYTQQAAYTMAIKAMYDGLKHLKDGLPVQDLAARRADAALMRQVDRTEEFKEWQNRYYAE